MDDRFYFLPFSVFPGIGPKTFQKLIDHFGSAKVVWEASMNDIRSAGLGEALTTKFDQFRNTFSPSEYAKRLTEANVSFLCLADTEYPTLLKQIKNPPIVLYMKGKMNFLLAGPAARSSQNAPAKPRFASDADVPFGSPSLASPASGNPAFATPFTSSIAVVGTRKITQYGREVTEMFTRDLVSAGFTIVSGLAMGVDAVAHQTTIENGGRTIAVLGCGVDCCTPTVNQHIYNSIISGGGCVVSEFPLEQAPTLGSFPSRNRIIAGLSVGVLVTEGAEDSGALITADYALSFGRSVYAVPGPITSQLSKGPYKLIQKGAKLVTKTEDILQESKIQNPKSNPPAGGQINSKFKIPNNTKATEEERKILEFLANEPLGFDEIVRKSGFDSAKVGSLLSLMELKGMIRSLDGGLFGITS